VPGRRRITSVWLLLLALTGVSWWLGRDGGGRDFGVVIVALAFLKIRFVLLDFMELRGAPLAMRYVGEAWVFVLAGAILMIYRL
jgi:hypothetical protein